MANQIPIDELRQLLRYDAGTGKLFWREGLKNNSYAGREAFTALSEDGRRIGSINRKMFKAHRVCFALAHGRWPRGMVDHVDGDPSNNRLSNLREATHSQNNANRKPKPGSASRYLGVSFDKRGRRWKGQVYKDNKNYNTPRRLCETAAALDRDRLARKLHGNFARLNVNA